MKRLTQSEYHQALRIFNRVVGIVGKSHSYHCKKFTSEIPDFVSANRWIMFPVKEINSIDEGKMAATPNVYISFPDDIMGDESGRVVEGGIGLTFNNTDAMHWLDEMFSVKSAPLFMALVNAMGTDWYAEITHKIKTDFYKSTPIYETVEEFQATSVTMPMIEKAIEDSNKSLPRPGDTHVGEVQGAITIFSVRKWVSAESFDSDVEKVFDLFFKVLALNQAKPSRLIPTCKANK